MKEQLTDLAAKAEALAVQLAKIKSEAGAPPGQPTPQNNDIRGDTFLQAYLAFQKSEKLEREGKFEQALIQARVCLEALDELTKMDPNWQPEVVAYRKKRAAEAEGRLRRK